MTRYRHLPLVAAFFLAAASASAQNVPANAPQQAQLRVVVVDQTGAGIPSATVRVVPGGGAPVEQSADDRGVTTLPPLAPGQVQLHVESGGFAPYNGTVTLRRGTNNQTVTLNIAGLQEEVVVNDTAIANDDRVGNSFTTTLTADDIAGLSDDPDELADQLDQMTGGAGASFIVDGFRGGRLPAKADILQIRFRLNSFAADNHDAGRVLVEIITRPGLTAWSGNANTGFRDDVLDARNAFAKGQTPEQLRRFTGGMRGPLVKNRTSLRINVDGNRSFDTGTIVAQEPNLFFTDLVRRPVNQTNVTIGLDHGITKSQTLRLEYRRSNGENQNLGVGDFNLAERAYSRTRTEDQLRASWQSIIRKSALNAFRVQFNHTDIGSQSLSTAPAVVVIDAFSSGGAGVANETNNKTVQISDDLDFTVRKKHAMRAGFLLEGGNYQQFDARNGNGTFTFGSLESYLAGLPTTYTQRTGQVQTSFGQYQLGMYWQDDVRLNRNLSVSVGVREEVQTHLKDSLNVMPRFGFTWNPFGWKTALRGGYGIFHDFFGTDLYDQTLRVNGVSQRDLLILNPGYPDPFSGTLATVLGGGRVQADPNLTMPYVHQASIGAERALSPALTLQASYAWQRGYNQLRSRNINAPNELGVRPEPTLGNISQIESTGRSLLDRLTLGVNYRLTPRRISMGTNYTLARAKNDGDNPLSLPANSLNPDLEWGPAAQDIRHHLNSMVNFPLPLAIRANINANVSSAAPYTITTGRDDNHDGVTNDRPDGVGRNSARGKSRIELNLRLTRGFGFGGARGGPNGPNNRAGAGAPPTAEQVVIQGPPPGGPVGGPGGGGLIGGGPGGVNQRFTVEFYTQASNLLNHTNFQNFSGNMLSPFFGNPTSASQARRIEIGMQFRF